MTFGELSKEAYRYLNGQQEICETKHLLSLHERWFYDQETGLIIFYNDDKVYLRIKFEAVGTISLISNTWLWSWDNSTTLENTRTDILQVKKFGERNEFDKLVKAKWDADMYDGWEMTTISAYLLKAKGAYRALNDTEDIFSFKLFKKIEVVDEIALEEMKNAQQRTEP
jgi:hypothetical protein